MVETKINYNEIMKEVLKEQDGTKRLLLHACCGPCSTYPLSILVDYFQVDILYLNQNIYPYEEWKKRLDTLISFVNDFNIKTNHNVKVFVEHYDHSIFLNKCELYKNEQEGGKRCELCHKLRLHLAYEYASKHNYDFFTTVMTVSSHKPSSFLNELGKELNKEFKNTEYLLSDFKKENGQLKGIQIAKEYGLYRQNYCGCEFALRNDDK